MPAHFDRPSADFGVSPLGECCLHCFECSHKRQGSRMCGPIMISYRIDISVESKRLELMAHETGWLQMQPPRVTGFSPCATLCYELFMRNSLACKGTFGGFESAFCS
jgi:hypothetical protein